MNSFFLPSTYFASDVIEAAKSDRTFDKANAQTISAHHGIALTIVREEIVFVRKNLKKIDPDWYNSQQV